MSSDFDPHPAEIRIDSYRLGEAVLPVPGAEPIHLTVIEFHYQGEMVNAVGLHPDLATEMAAALLATRQ